MKIPPLFHSRFAAVFLVAIGAVQVATAQLAITEVMSVARANTNTGFRGPDYWELTNFSTNDVDLDGYGFRDGVPTRPPVTDLFTNLVIRAGESIIFFRVADSKDVVTNAVGFRAWWGESKLPPDLRFYAGGDRYQVHFEPLAEFRLASVDAAERERRIDAAVRAYALKLEALCRAHPYNWFNFHDFWGEEHGD